MNELEFSTKRAKDWERLAHLCEQADSSPKSLGSTELIEFVSLYRKAAADLALVRTEGGNWELAAGLNILVARAYGIVYREPTKRFREVVLNALVAGAQSVRKLKWSILASLVIFLAGGIFGGMLLHSRSDLRSDLLPPGFEEVYDHWKNQKMEARSGESMFSMWVFYSINNSAVTIMQTSTGIATCGIGSAVMNWRTGTMMGTLVAEVAQTKRVGYLIEHISPHGASELSGAILGGGAGLNIGYALLAPGRRSRWASVREAGKHAMVVFVMAVLMMFIAAPFEAFLSFNPNFPLWIKPILGGLIFSAWMLYWSRYAIDEPEK